MANEQLPPDAYGPINKDRPGNIDPFAKFDNYIRYQDMVRYQTISQYEQSSITPQSLSWYQQRGMARGAYQYGTGDDQTERYYRRQREMTRVGQAGGVVSGAATFAPVATIAMGGLVTGMGISAIAAIPGIYIARGVDRSMERQRLMQEMAIDLDQRRSSLGFNSPLSYNDSTNLAAKMLQNMGPGPGEGRLGGAQPFFNREQGLRIHKIALANNMINARGYGADAGTMRQYEKNFQELTKTTEDVVKLLQTTIEGGMAVIKNLQQSGFRTMKDVNAQIRQAKAFGGLTGLGAENMMQVGAAGAQAVQGTPYSAMVGANMFQQGAAQAGMMARGSMAGQYLIDRVGGVGAAGAAIGRFHMNIFSSGMGTKLAAYMMNPDGSVNRDRMARVTSGKVGVDEMLSGAGQLAYAMGPNRAAFEEKKMMLYNDPTTKGWQRDALTIGLFNMWRARKPGNVETHASVFAGLGTNDIQEQQLIKNYLLGQKGYWAMDAASNVESALLNRQRMGVEPYGLKGLVYNVNRGMTRWGENVGTAFTNKITKSYNWLTNDDLAGTYVDQALLWAGKGLGVVNPNRRSLFRSGNIGDLRAGLSRSFGLESIGDMTRGLTELYRAGVPVAPVSAGKIPTVANVHEMTSGQIDRVLQNIQIASNNGKLRELGYNVEMISDLQGLVPKGRPSWGLLKFQADPLGFMNAFPAQIARDKSTVDAQYRTRQMEYMAQFPNHSYNAKLEEQKMGDLRVKFIMDGTYGPASSELDKKRISLLAVQERKEILSGVGDYNAQLVSSQLQEKDILNMAAKTLFFKTSTSPDTRRSYGRGGWETTGSKTVATTSAFDTDLIRKIQKVLPAFNPELDSTGMREMVLKYDELNKLIRTEGGAAKVGAMPGGADLLDFYRTVNPMGKSLLNLLPAIGRTDVWSAFSSMTAKSQAAIRAAEKMSIPMSEQFRQQFVDVVTGTIRGGGVQDFVTKNEEILNRMAGTQRGYFTKDLGGGLDFANRFFGTAETMAGMAGVEKERKRDVITALQYALAGDTSRINTLGRDAFKLSGTDSSIPNKLAALDMTKEKDIKKALDIFTGLYKMDESGSVTTDDRGNTRYANVNPPITNYWNNRWVL
jgi:hypothetical protein